MARRFGREAFAVALISHSQGNVDRLAAEIKADGVQARGYAADVQDGQGLAEALQRAKADSGPITVLQYSPVPSPEFLRPVLDTTADNLAAAARFSILGPAFALREVLPDMSAQGAGTILFVNGSSAATPNGNVAGTSVAFAGESAYGQMLHEALAPQGIHVGQLIIPGAIGGGDPLYAPAALADRLWHMHVQRGDFRVQVAE